jgi:RNA polymerase sigma-70 factor (ECF subfamily)
LADHGDYLFRVARRQLHADELAEDAVQETLLAALSARDRYTGNASPRTWLTGILKHKIVDLIRRQMREVELPRDQDGEEAVDLLFKQDGHWAEPLRPWGNPHAEAELSQLRRVLDECADRLKPVMAQVFSLREVAGLETEEICKELDITSTNCWVLLHRARLFMRQCRSEWIRQRCRMNGCRRRETELAPRHGRRPPLSGAWECGASYL